MKTIKKIFIIALLGAVLLPFFCSNVDAMWIETGGSGNPKEESSSGGKGSSGPAGLSALTHSHTSFIGVMVTLIQYDSTKSTDEVELGKVLYLTSANGLSSAGSSGDYHEESPNVDHEDLYVDHSGGQSSCGHTHPAPEDVTDYHISVTWAGVDPENLFHGFPKRVDVFDFTLGGKTNSLREGTFARGGGGRPKGLLFVKLGSPDKVRSAFGLPDLNINDFFETYYLKIEPVYRYFAAPLGSVEPAVGGLTPNLSSVKPGSGANKVEFGDYAGTNKKVLCGHSKIETWNELKYADKDDEGNCPTSSSSYTKSSGDCSKTISHTEPLKLCYYFYYYNSMDWSINGVSSYVFIPRESGNTEYIKTFYNSYFDASTHKKVIDVDGSVISGRTDYLVGSTYKNAIANAPSNSQVRPYHPFDSSYNKYKLVGNIDSSVMNNWGEYVVGMWLTSLLFDKEEDCVARCGYIENPDNVYYSSNEYLQCAQSFCDSTIEYEGYATNNKRDCIVNNCKYKPKRPIDCEHRSDLADETFLRGARSATNANNEDSCCGYTVTNPADPSSKMKTKDVSIGSYADCKRYGDTLKINENGMLVYKYGTSDTQNTYINVACDENSKFGFPDLSGAVIKPGTGYEYPISLEGNRSCEIFFDTVSWTYDFASTHSLDRIRKRMLLQKLEAYNLIASKGTNATQINGSDLLGSVVLQEKNGPYVSLSQIEGDLPVVSSFKYSSDLSKVGVTATTEEYVGGTKYTGGYKFYNGGGDIVFDRTSFDESVNLYYDGFGTMTKYNQYVVSSSLEADREIPEVGYETVNSYQITSSVEALYELPNVCIDDTNQNKKSLANEAGTCDRAIYGDNAAARKYYTDYKYKKHDEYNNIKVKTNVLKTDMNGAIIGTATYLKVDDRCHYSYEPNIQCKVIINKENDCYPTDTLVLENETSITAKLQVTNKTTNKEDVKSQLIYATVGGTTISGKRYIDIPLQSLGTTTTSSTSISSNNKIVIKGEVTLDDGTPGGKKVTCSDTINVLKSSSNTSCNIEMIDVEKYRIHVSGINNPTVYITTTLQKDAAGNLSFVKVLPVNGGYYFSRVLKAENDAVIAKVEGSNGTAYCQLTYTCPPAIACKEIYQPDEELKIKQYCADN